MTRILPLQDLLPLKKHTDHAETPCNPTAVIIRQWISDYDQVVYYWE